MLAEKALSGAADSEKMRNEVSSNGPQDPPPRSRRWSVGKASGQWRRMDVAVDSSEEVAPVRTAEQMRVEHERVVAEAMKRRAEHERTVADFNERVGLH